jgi:hypothetical protein
MNRRRKIWFWLPRYTKVWKVVSKDFSHYHHKFPTPVVHTCQDSSNVSFQDLHAAAAVLESALWQPHRTYGKSDNG